MTVLAYSASSHPSPEERRAAPEGAHWANAQRWRGETTRADEVIAHRADIRAAYAEKGVRTRPFRPPIQPVYAPAPDEKSTDFTVPKLKTWLEENDPPPGFWDGEERSTALALKS